MEDVWQDDFEINDLLNFLEQKQVIPDAKNWAVENSNDTDGSIFEETYTSVEFVRRV